jgi:type III restriction enzyme
MGISGGYLQFSEEEQREIVFKDITTGEVTHTTMLDTAGIADYRSVIGYFAQTIMKDCGWSAATTCCTARSRRLCRMSCSTGPVDLERPQHLRNLSELAATKTLIETFKKAINALTVQDKGRCRNPGHHQAAPDRPFVVKDQGYLVPKKSVFNRIIGDSHFELLSSPLPGRCEMWFPTPRTIWRCISSWTTSTPMGDISNYYPDFWSSCPTARLSLSKPKGRKIWTCR